MLCSQTVGGGVHYFNRLKKKKKKEEENKAEFEDRRVVQELRVHCELKSSTNLLLNKMNGLEEERMAPQTFLYGKVTF